MPGLLALVQLHFTASSGTSASEFSILPNSNTPCPMRPCYTLSQVMDNPSNYFTSNTTVVFPPGHHEVSTEGQLVIQNVNNISLVGDNNDSTKIKCVGDFGLAFINITNLTVSKLQFSMCGAPKANTSQLGISLFKKILHSFTYPNKPPPSATLSIYLLHITNLIITDLSISHSRGIGLLVGNIFGVSTIQQAVFFNNTPNCAIVFLDSFSPMETPVLHIADILVVFGTVSGVHYSFTAAGLNVIAIQTAYCVKSYIRNVTLFGNAGNVHGNMLLRINCKMAIQVTRINCTGYGFYLELKGESINCNSQVQFHMSHSYFARNNQGTSLSLISSPLSVRVKLENITIEKNRVPLYVALNCSSLLIMKNVNISQNLGPVYVTSVSPALCLTQCIVTFYGNTTFLHNKDGAIHVKDSEINFQKSIVFLHNKGLYGGAIYAKNAVINIYGNMMFQENVGEKGGALMLYQNVSVVIGQFAEVSFVRNRAQESGGAVYARDSQIIIRTGQKFSFVGNEGYDGGAITLTGSSTIYLEAKSSITFVRNHAYHYGGAIYYVDDYNEDLDFERQVISRKCFYGILSTEFSFSNLRKVFIYIKKKSIGIKFYNNTAGSAGTAIYGGWVDICVLYINYRMIFWYKSGIYLSSVFDSLFHLDQSTQQLSLISSNPTRVCLCTTKSIPDCSITNYTVTAYPGETLTIPAVAVGQRFGTVPSTVHSSFVHLSDVPADNGRLPELQYTQLVTVNCTNLTYTILSSPNKIELMVLKVERHNQRVGRLSM